VYSYERVVPTCGKYCVPTLASFGYLVGILGTHQACIRIVQASQEQKAGEIPQLFEVSLVGLQQMGWEDETTSFALF
jgi:putative component of membrane protein insertase Oxa1/YidC/SpoIIIJ protein YidD